MATVHNLLEMGLGSQFLCATQKESSVQNKQMTAVGYISDATVIINPSWSHFQYNGAPVFKLSDTSTLLPALSAKNIFEDTLKYKISA